MGAVGPKAPASRTPSQAAGGSGAAKRTAPTGGAAYGMPRKAAMPSGPVRPSTVPYPVLTRGRPLPPAALIVSAPPPTPVNPVNPVNPLFLFPGTVAQACDG